MPENHNLTDFLADTVSTGRALGPFTPVRALFTHLGYELVAANLQGQLRPTSSSVILLAGLIISISRVEADPIWTGVTLHPTAFPCQQMGSSDIEGTGPLETPQFTLCLHTQLQKTWGRTHKLRGGTADTGTTLTYSVALRKRLAPSLSLEHIGWISEG